MKPKSDQTSSFNILEVLENFYKNVAIGISPVAELGLKWKDEADLK